MTSRELGAVTMDEVLRHRDPIATARAALMRLACAAALLAVASASQAQEPWSFAASAGAMHRALRETSAVGSTLLTERGWLAVVRGQAMRSLADGAALEAELGLAAGDLAYDGQTQAGAPLQTRSRHTEWSADLRWRPFAPAVWGELWASAGWLSNRRGIAGTAAAGGLTETSDAWLAGVRWASPALAVDGDWRARATADARLSTSHRLHVDYHGLLDASSLRGARKRHLALRVMAEHPASPWSFELGWARLAQDESESAAVYRNTVLFGTVRQPALRVDDVNLSVSRRF